MSQHPVTPSEGFGARPPDPTQPGPKKSNLMMILLIVVGVGIVGVGVLAAVAIPSFRSYISRAKQAEARATVATLANAAKVAFAANGALCPSAASPIPANADAVSGKKYLSSAAEWTSDPGFGCLGFFLGHPQYYQYHYESTPTTFVVTARGDLDGDGQVSVFTLRGQVERGQVVVDQALEVTDAAE